MEVVHPHMLRVVPHSTFLPSLVRMASHEQQFACKHHLCTLTNAAQVRVVEFDEGTPFREQLAAMAATGVLVSVHTSNLANAQFLPPGRAVVELLQRNWVWHNLDKSFQARAPPEL